MPDRPDWTYGTILVNRRARIMFLGWDDERRRILGGGQPWFRAMKLDATRFSFTANADEVGEIANFTPYGWKAEEPADPLVELFRSVGRGGKMAAMRSAVVGENGPERLLR